MNVLSKNTKDDLSFRIRITFASTVAGLIILMSLSLPPIVVSLLFLCIGYNWGLVYYLYRKVKKQEALNDE